MINILDFKETINKLNNDDNIHNEYIFYYDETNNYKKVKIREKSLNVNDAFYKDYVLGGFCHLKENECLSSISSLFQNDLKKYLTGELKAAKLFKECKTFLDCLNKSQVGVILNWINENGFIHYISMNCFYYSIIDLVDSFFTEEPELLMPKEVVDIIKNEIFLLLFSYKEEFIEFAYSINYPNVTSENVEVLCNWLINLIEIANYNGEFNLELAKQVIKSKRKSKSLLFLKNNEENTIVESFYALRQQKCIVYNNSHHVFDEESTDEELMKQNPMTIDNKSEFKNFEFKNSKNDRLIQISDVVVSLIAKYLDFIDNTKTLDIKSSIEKLNSKQRNNLKLLIELIDKSYHQDAFLIGTINAININYFRNNTKEYIYNLLNNY